VKKTGKEGVQADIEQRPLFDLPAGDVLIRVRFSSLNYKDALAASEWPGVVRTFALLKSVA
jgi:NADPH:quinone reductase-like Zn-dependent oxidoreductase